MSREVYPPKRFEEYARVLDFLPAGKPEIGRATYRAEPLVQLVGEVYFTLLEAAANYRVMFRPHERVYVGKDQQRKKISHIIGRVHYSDLTSASKTELSAVVEDVVREDEARFVSFFNVAQPITPRMHSLELLPGIGKKYMLTILDEREKQAFTSYKDIQDRTGAPDPSKLVARRIVEELAEDSKYRVFTRPP